MTKIIYKFVKYIIEFIMKYFLRIILFYLFIFCDVSYSQRSIPKTIINQKGVFVESIISSGGNKKEGIMTFENGDKIIGEWRNDTLNGLAKIIYKDGYIEQGKWRKGVLKEKYDILEFYEDARINASVKQSLNNKNNGKLRNYTRNGEIISEEHFLNGKKIKQIEFENDFDKRIKIGEIKSEVNYGDEFETKITYRENEKISITYIINTDSRDGWETHYSKNGVLISRSLWKKDNRISYEKYFENGTLRAFEDDIVFWVVNEKGERISQIDKKTKTGFKFFVEPDDNKNFLKWVGEFDIDSKNYKGKGTLYFTDGDKIIGNYSLGERIGAVIINSGFQGECEYHFKDGDVLKGLYKNGSFNGDGSYTFNNGNVYKGNFKNSLFDGYGKLFYNNVVIKEGIWENGKLVKDYNKDIVSTNTKEKSSGQNKKYTSPPLHLSTKELAAWFDSEDGLKYLNKSGLMDGILNNLFAQAGEMANNNSSSYSASTQSKSSGNKSCQRCNIAFQKPYLRDRCKIEWKKESKPGYVLCKTCQGYGFTTTNIGCNCPDGIGWCYDKECPVSSCESGWIKCSH